MDHSMDALRYATLSTAVYVDTASTVFVPGFPTVTVIEGDYSPREKLEDEWIVVCAYCQTEWTPEEGKVGTCLSCGGNVRKKIKIIWEKEEDNEES